MTKGERLIGSMSAIKARAPVLGGNFGIWGGLFSSFDCAVKGYRQKEDPWNAIISGFLTGGSLALRGELCSIFGLVRVGRGEGRRNRAGRSGIRFSPLQDCTLEQTFSFDLC